MRKMCVCSYCEEPFEYEDIRVVRESRGEFWGAPCYETMYYSPCCMERFTEEWVREEDDEIEEEDE